MKVRKTIFRAEFNNRNAHWVNVVVHTSTPAMRRVLRTRGMPDPSDTAAACWQANQPGKDQCVAELHFAADTLCYDHIVHECTHASFHRAALVGFKRDDEEYEEWVCDAAGTLSDRILGLLLGKGVRVRFLHLKKQPV